MSQHLSRQKNSHIAAFNSIDRSGNTSKVTRKVNREPSPACGRRRSRLKSCTRVAVEYGCRDLGRGGDLVKRMYTEDRDGFAA